MLHGFFEILKGSAEWFLRTENWLTEILRLCFIYFEHLCEFYAICFLFIGITKEKNKIEVLFVIYRQMDLIAWRAATNSKFFRVLTLCINLFLSSSVKKSVYCNIWCKGSSGRALNETEYYCYNFIIRKWPKFLLEL